MWLQRRLQNLNTTCSLVCALNLTRYWPIVAHLTSILIMAAFYLCIQTYPGQLCSAQLWLAGWLSQVASIDFTCGLLNCHRKARYQTMPKLPMPAISDKNYKDPLLPSSSLSFSFITALPHWSTASCGLGWRQTKWSHTAAIKRLGSSEGYK